MLTSPKPPLPFSPGGEVAGIVTEVGEGVTGLAIGDRVFASTGWGGLAERVAVQAEAAIAVPEGIDPEEVKKYLTSLPGALEVHDLHIWAMSTTETAMTAHLVMPGDSCRPEFLCDVSEELHHRFEIEHSTLQVETPDAPDPCRLASDEAV